jgi:hypothetical protein
MQNVSVFIIIHISYTFLPYIMAIFREFQIFTVQTQITWTKDYTIKSKLPVPHIFDTENYFECFKHLWIFKIN